MYKIHSSLPINIVVLDEYKLSTLLICTLVLQVCRAWRSNVVTVSTQFCRLRHYCSQSYIIPTTDLYLIPTSLNDLWFQPSKSSNLWLRNSELGSHGWDYLKHRSSRLEKWFNIQHIEIRFALSIDVHFNLFVYHCEVCDYIQLHTWMFRILYIRRKNDVIFTCFGPP
jgi:hypothetical protein